MELKYVLEYFGTMIILVTKILSNRNPLIIGLVSFSVFWMTKDITSGYFTPFGPLASYMIGNTTIEELTYNTFAQYAGAFTAIIFLHPFKAFIKHI